MANDLKIGIEELLRGAHLAQNIDSLRDGTRAVSQALMEPEVMQYVGVQRLERTTARTRQPDHREHARVGTIDLKYPRVTSVCLPACSI